LNRDLAEVRDYWEAASCGEALYYRGEGRSAYDRQASERYRLEPYISSFAQFERYGGRRVLEIGVGLGADHERFAAAGADLFGLDLTQRAVEHTRNRLAQRGLSSSLWVASAEQLPFPDAAFDLVYSWGVLHVTPNTQMAVDQVFRVLRPDGEAKVMIYHKHSVVGYMLWLRYALGRGRPWLSLSSIYEQYLESPGTKAYTLKEARALFSRFDIVSMRTQLTHADLLTSPVGQRHRGLALRIARRVWPRRFISRMFPRHGLFLMVQARKPQQPTTPQASRSQ
jgi:ubiquinone/menaquinone biosynthesis C-methylase UbiE